MRNDNQFWASHDEIIIANYNRVDIKELCTMLLCTFTYNQIHARANKLGLVGIKEEKLPLDKAEIEKRLENIEKLLGEKYAELNKIHMLNKGYEKLLNDINNLEITFQNLRNKQ